MRAQPFTRSTLIAAVELLEGDSQARFNQMVLHLGLFRPTAESERLG